MTTTIARRFVNSGRQGCLAGLCVLLALAADSRVSSQGGQTIGGYQLVSEQRQKNTIVDTYRATLTNGSSRALAATIATLKKFKVPQKSSTAR